MLTKNNILLISLCTLLMGGVAQAEEQAAPAKTPARTKKVQVNFSDELVKGASEKPDVDSLSVRKDFNYKKLIRVRENFQPEMEDGLNDFKGH